MGFEKPRDCAMALKKLEGLPLMGMEVRVYVMTEKGRAVELFFNAEEGGNEDGEDD